MSEVHDDGSVGVGPRWLVGSRSSRWSLVGKVAALVVEESRLVLETSKGQLFSCPLAEAGVRRHHMGVFTVEMDGRSHELFGFVKQIRLPRGAEALAQKYAIAVPRTAAMQGVSLGVAKMKLSALVIEALITAGVRDLDLVTAN